MRVTSRGGSRDDSRLGSSRLIAVVAFLLPALIFAAVLTGLYTWETGHVAIRNARSDAQAIMVRVDAELRHDVRALTAVAKRITGAPITQPRPTAGSAAFNAELFPQWLGSIVWSRDTGQTLFSSLPGDDLPAPSPAWAARLPPGTTSLIDGIEPIGGRPAVLVHVPVPDDARNLVVTTALDPARFQDILMSRAPEAGVSAIVDRNGNFIARSRDFESRVGTPASTFVRDAIKLGGSGDYRGRTLEGIENYSAYQASDYSGWSTHFAIDADRVEAGIPGTAWVAIVGGMLSFVLAAGLVWLVQRDSQRRHRAEHAMANARRVETLGRLTGGIAHDFNNLLTVIIGSLERGRKRSADPAAVREMGLALEAARRAATLTRSLLLYSRQQVQEAETVDVKTCVEEAADVIRRTVGAQYEVITSFGDGALFVRADSAQLASALLNLAINARDAMPAGGVITLHAGRRRIARPDDATGLAAGEHVEIVVADNGPGMPPDVAQRAFDPFFTTKDVGKGTGLGLAQVDAFTRQHGGLAELDTAPGNGVRVAMIFPLADPPAPARAAAPAGDIPGGLRVLVVEDEPGVREHACALLAELGCEVVACPNAACAYAELERGRFDLLFTDIVLPGGESGVSIAEQVASRYPAMAIVLATGYAGGELHGKEDRWPLVLKPYALAELTTAISTALQGAQTRLPA